MIPDTNSGTNIWLFLHVLIVSNMLALTPDT